MAAALVLALVGTGCEPTQPNRGEPVIKTSAKAKKKRKPRGKPTVARVCKRTGRNIAGKPICVEWE